MLEIPYDMLITSEMLNTQIEFCKNASNSIEETDSAVEGYSDPQLRSIVGASMNYIVSSSVSKMRKSLRAFIDSLKSFVNGRLNDMLVRIGVDNEFCIDRANVTEFLNHNWDRIIGVQRDINSELRIMKRGSMMKDSGRKRSDINDRIKMVSADFERWKKHTEAKKVEVRRVKDTIVKFKDMINELNLGMKDLELIESRIESIIDIPVEISQNINSLIQLMTYSVNVYTILVNSLEGSIEPLTRLAQNTSNAVKLINPKNHYDDNVDIKVIRGY